MKPRSSSGSIRKKRWKNWILILTQRFPFAHISAGSELPDVAVRNWIIARRRCSSHNMESVIETGGGKIYRHMVECDHWFSGVYTGDLFSGFPSQTVWHILIISALLEISYYIVLGDAYKDSDFSLVYPMGRGAAPALIAVWAAIFLHERFTLGGLIGIIIIVVGLLIVGGGDIFQTHTKPHTRGILLALLLALLISIYSILDGVAVKQTAALPY